MRVGLGGSGNVTAAQLYAPYGGLRYSSGAMPTAKGFTGQRADALSGLDYYGARSYDAVAGQFTSADTVANGRSPYAYVRGNPETLTDPTGHRYTCPDGGCGGGGKNPPPTAPGDGNSNGSGGNSGDGTGPHSCDAQCQQEKDDATRDFWVGLGEAGGTLISDIACMVMSGGACFAWVRLTLPILLEGAHRLLNALDVYRRLVWGGGSVGDIGTLLIRAAKVTIDVLQVILLITNFSDMLSAMRKASGFLEGFSAVAKEAFDSPEPDTTTFGKFFVSTYAIGDLITDGGLGDWQDLTDSEKACVQSHCLG